MAISRGRLVDLGRLSESLELFIYQVRGSTGPGLSHDATCSARCVWGLIDSLSPEELVVAGDPVKSRYVWLLWDAMNWIEIGGLPDVEQLTRIHGLLTADPKKVCDTTKKVRSSTYYPDTEHGQRLIERWKRLPPLERERINKSQFCREFCYELNAEREAVGLHAMGPGALRQVLTRYLRACATS